MQYPLEESHRILGDTVARATREVIAPAAQELDRTDRPMPAILDTLHRIGVATMCHPARVGGPGPDPVACCVATEEIAKASPAVAVMCVANWAAVNVMAARPGAVADAFLSRGMEKPTLAAYCLTEPRGGSDVAHLETRAVLSGGNYRLDGAKCFVTNGGEAEIYVVVAATDADAGAAGTTAFLAERDTPGFEITRLEEKMGTRGTTLAQIAISSMELPVSHRIGAEGEGLKLAMESQNISRVSLAASCVGLAQGALDHALAYSGERVQFGRAIGTFQGIQFKLADMATKVEAARSLTYRAAEAIVVHGWAAPEARTLAAMAKMYASDVAMEATTEAVQVFGGYGYLKGAPVEMLMRDAKVFQIFAGTNEIQKRTIFKNLERR